MVKKFSDLKGKASKSGPDRFKYVDGVNRYRIVSEVVPGYKYWLKAPDGTNIPFDCLTFDREKEVFTKGLDPVRKHFPDKKCSWAYTSFVIDRADGKLKLIDHKKKLFEQILLLSKRLGDPTDPDGGWDVVAERVKTGPKAYNVEYTLDQLGCADSKGPLTEEEKKMIEEQMPNIEEYLTLQTAEQQEELIKSKILAETTDEVDEEAEKEFAGEDDL
jgi:hypothetical protein